MKSTRITLIQPKPRNPLVAACHHRAAGAHRRTPGGRRQRAEQALQRELQHERHPS